VETSPSSPTEQACCYSGPADLKALAELDRRFGDQLLQVGLARDQRKFSHVVAVEMERVEGDHHDPGRLALQLVLRHREVGGAVGGRDHDLAVDDCGPRVDGGRDPDITGTIIGLFSLSASGIARLRAPTFPRPGT
jgi:hypothetical protein